MDWLRQFTLTQNRIKAILERYLKVELNKPCTVDWCILESYDSENIMISYWLVGGKQKQEIEIPTKFIK